MIETNRLILKPLTSDELKKHIKFPYLFAEELGLTPSKSLIEEETKEAILNDLLPYIDNPKKEYLFFTMWLIIEKTQKAIIGGLCFHGEPNDSNEVEIGFGTDEEYRNQGFMTEAVKGISQWLKLNKNIKSIIAETDKDNLASIRVLEKNNFSMYGQNGNLILLKMEI